jgi:hypothetical protein
LPVSRTVRGTAACALQQLTTTNDAGYFDANGSCAASADPAWCYVTGAAAGGCAQAVLFSNGEQPPGVLVDLVCTSP